ncbi:MULTISPECIES: HU family DNA-binding protein [Desulfovibrio]|uniref:DNA-binding protein HBsu n=1 Tax=Desulfovibrio piger TaxID=901 RepID=A0A1K1LC88_9BACT|nr:HU family DNA-binding protein [Desulfovibrio piger]SFV72323.1 DNA-binding protein HBsu [Desulfovibrio piger]
MTKYEFLKAVADSLRAAHPDRDVSTVMVEATLAAMGDVAAAELLGGGEVPLLGLGKLKVRTTAARQGRNPRTGEPVSIPAGRRAVFVPGSALKEALKE